MPRDPIPAELDRRVRQAARHRCGYCLSPQRLVMARLEIEHIVPVAKGGDSRESNLWLSCPLCNRFKADRTSARDPDTKTEVPLFNPRIQALVRAFSLVGRRDSGARAHADGPSHGGPAPPGR